MPQSLSSSSPSTARPRPAPAHDGPTGSVASPGSRIRRARSSARLATIAALLLTSGCSREEASAPPPATGSGAATAQAAASVTVAWVTPRSADGVTLMEAPAEVLAQPQSRAAIAAPFSARVAKVHVRPGEQVRAGQVLIDVVMPDVVRAAGESLAATLRIQAYDRQRTQLLALRDQGMAKLADLAEVETRLAEARAAQQAAAALLRVAGLEPSDAGAVARSGMVPLTTPISGTVVALQASVGEVSGADGAPLARVAATDGAGRIQARLPSAPPNDARFRFLPPLGAPVEVRMEGRAPQVDARDATTSAWFEPIAPDAALIAGQSGRLHVLSGPDAHALTVPARAITFREGRPHLWVRSSGSAEPQSLAVEVLLASGSQALVRGEGLTAETRVAADASALDAPEPGHD